MSWFATLLIFMVVITLTAVVFCGWVAFTVVRLIVSGMATIFGLRPRRRFAPFGPAAAGAVAPARFTPPPQGVRCQTRGCCAANPRGARFCRRCGRGLPMAQPVQVRRAAVW